MVDFRGNGFILQIPEDWVDSTIYTFVGSITGGGTYWVRVNVEKDPVAGGIADYARTRLDAMLTVAGTRLLKREEGAVHESFQAAQAEIRWQPTDDLRIYQRVLVGLWPRTGVTLVTQMNKKERQTVGPTLDRILAGVRPRSAASDPEEGWVRFDADRFSLLAPGDWSDQSVYSLAEPDESQFRRNLVIQRRIVPDPDQPLQELASQGLVNLQETVKGIEDVEQTDSETADGSPAVRLDFTRAVEGGRVRQTQLLARREDTLHVLNLTTELDPPEEINADLERVITSFAFGDAGGESTEPAT
jgi:hypothetical protein